MSRNHLKYFMLQKSICTLLKVNCHTLYNFDFAYDGFIDSIKNELSDSTVFQGFY
jgi:hypothetical protein